MTQSPKIASGVQLFLLDDEGLLFSEPQQKIYTLNTMAAVIWCLIEDSQTSDQMSDHLCDTYDLGRDKSASFVEEALGNWRALGVLDTTDVQTPDPAKEVPDRSHFPPLPDAGTRPHRLQLKLLSSVLELRFESAEMAALVKPVFIHLLTDGSAQPTVVIDVFHSEARYWLYAKDAPGLTCEDLDQLAPIVKAAVWSMSVYAQDFFLDIHAGVVANETACVILPAKAGSGKSSLTAALMHSGLTYFSDEIALIDDAFCVMPAPLSLCVKSAGWDLMKPYLANLEDQPVHRRTDKKIVRYVPPPADRMPLPNARLPIEMIVFPAYAPTAVTQLRPLTKVEALRRLMNECQAVPVHLTGARVQALIGWISDVSCFELPMSDLTRAVEEITSTLSKS